MQMRILVISASVRVPATSFGLNINTTAILEFRHTQNAPPHCRYGINRTMTLGKHSSTVLGAFFNTIWFNVDSSKNEYFSDLSKMAGKFAILTIDQLVIGRSPTDIRFVLLTQDNDEILIIKKSNIYTDNGFQYQSGKTMVRGKINTLPLE